MSRVSDIELQVADEQKVVGLERYRELQAALAIASNWMVVPSDVPAQHVERLGQARDDVRRALDNARLILGGDQIRRREARGSRRVAAADPGAEPGASILPDDEDYE